MRCKSLIVLCLVVIGMALAPLQAAWAQYTFSLVTNDGITPKTWFEPGDVFYVDIVIDDAGDIAGCAFTLEYPSNVLIPPEIDGKGISDDISSAFPFTFNSDEIHRGNIGGPGKLHLAGVAISPATGGALYAAGPVALFRVRFAVSGNAAPGSIPLTLKPTELWNPAEGYGVDHNDNSLFDAGDEMGNVDVLVGAVDNQHPDWADQTKAFPVLLPFPSPVLAAFPVHIVDSSTVTPPAIALPEGYDNGNPATWPLIHSAETRIFQATGGTGDFAWSVTGPVNVAGGTGGSFEFQAPSAGAFAGSYTVTATDAITGENRSFFLKVPMTIGPPTPIINEDQETNSFWVEGAPEGTSLSISLVTPGKTGIENAAENLGQVAPENPYFDEDARAEFDFVPAAKVGENKSFRFEVEAIEEGNTKPLTDAGLHIAYSEIINFAPMVDEAGGTFTWDQVAVSIPPGALADARKLEVNANIPVDATSLFTEKSTVLVMINIEGAP